VILYRIVSCPLWLYRAITSFNVQRNFSQSVISDWNRLPDYVVEAPLLTHSWTD